MIAVFLFAHFHAAPKPQLDVMMLFGFLVAIATLVCYIEQFRSRSYILAFALCSALLASFAFMKDAWPVGLVESVWSVAAVYRWWTAPASLRTKRSRKRSNPWQPESRITRMFGHEIPSN
jgi:membrane protein implicated in regulation of membrane protease activity